MFVVVDGVVLVCVGRVYGGCSWRWLLSPESRVVCRDCVIKVSINKIKKKDNEKFISRVMIKERESLPEMQSKMLAADSPSEKP